MSILWLVSEDAPLVQSLAHHLRAFGDVYTGAPERAAFGDAPAPDLVVTGLSSRADGSRPDARGAADPLDRLERILGFLRGVPAPRREPAPVLYVGSPDRRPSPTLFRSLVDDRRTAALPWPLDVSRLLEAVELLLEAPSPPPSLRERARREWVGERVGRWYAGLELPELRHAIDPRNAARPVLLVGEPGTHRGLLARYIHNLAEPARDDLVVVPARDLDPTRLEALLLERTAGQRVTLLVEDLDAATPAAQAALGQLLSESGALAIESIRWIASAGRPSALHPTLAGLAWLRVPLPPLRERPDLETLVTDLAGDTRIEPDAIEALRHYLWPGNLRELEAVLDATLAAHARRGGAPAVTRADLRFAPADSGATRPPDSVPPTEPPPDTDVQPLATNADFVTQEDLLEETLVSASDLPDAVPDFEPDSEPDLQPVDAPMTRGELADASGEPAFDELVTLLGEQLRQPLLAVRTCSGLLEQNPDDEDVRRELASVAAGDLARVEEWLDRFAQFSRFGAPKLEPVSLSSLANAELKRQDAKIRDRSLVVLRELDDEGPPALADPEQLRFALEVLFDCALRLMPDGGDLYVGSLYQAGDAEREARHRLLMRFYSPEDVLVGPDELPGAREPLEVVWARILLSRGGAEFAVDTSGSQDNVVLVALPCL